MAMVKRHNADGTEKKKNRNSSNQKQKLREKDVETRTKFSTTKKSRSSKARTRWLARRPWNLKGLGLCRSSVSKTTLRFTAVLITIPYQRGVEALSKL